MSRELEREQEFHCAPATSGMPFRHRGGSPLRETEKRKEPGHNPCRSEEEEEGGLSCVK